MSWWHLRGHVKVSARNPRAWGLCDCCGFAYPLNELPYQYQYAGQDLINTHFRVCKACLDKPSHVRNPYAIPADPLPVRDPRLPPNDYASSTGFSRNGTILTLTSLQGYPTSPMGLPPGSVWSDSLTVKVTSGVIPNPQFPAVYYGGEISAFQLRIIGGGNLPITDPGIATQLWNNNGVVNIGTGKLLLETGYAILLEAGGYLLLG